MFRRSFEKLIGPDAPLESIYRDIVRRMAKSGVKFRSGMRQSAIDVVEERTGFQFPADLREFWSVAVPIGGGWVDWETSPPSIQWVEDWITRELLFDAKHGAFWPEDLEPASDDPAEMEAQLRAWGRKGPQLIPLFGHRAMVGEALNAGNPVLSIWQSDWIYYGWDLPSYLGQEALGEKIDYANAPTIKPIGQWDQIVG